MNEKIVLRKEYERDFCLVLEQTWCAGLSKELQDRYGFSNTNLPYYILFATSENLQFWEHRKAIEELRQWLLFQNTAGEDFIGDVIAEYQSTGEEMNRLRADGSAPFPFSRYLDVLRRLSVLLGVCFYSGNDERTPKQITEKLVQLRETDDIYVSNDCFIRENLRSRGVPAELAHLVGAHEFEDPPEERELLKRRMGALSIDGGEVATITLEDFAREHPEYELEGFGSDLTRLREARGKPAYKGVIRGTVKIVKNKRAAAEVRSGDILVSPMTTPDFIVGMHKAAAFVTDEGGIMCHAAIIAREMKKPCVIGTKIASQVFKDGDMVEVDAEKGIVRKL